MVHYEFQAGSRTATLLQQKRLVELHFRPDGNITPTWRIRCEQCGEDFLHEGSTSQRYCSEPCQVAARRTKTRARVAAHRQRQRAKDL